MEIHFRAVNKAEAVFLEVNGAFYRFESTQCLDELPGVPLEYGDFQNPTMLRLQNNSFLKETSGEDDFQGTVTLQLPSPLKMYKANNPVALRKAQTWTNRNAMKHTEFHAFAHWWEYLRRSKVFQRDCEHIRRLLSNDKGLIWAAFAGWTGGFLMAASTSREKRAEAVNAFLLQNNVSFGSVAAKHSVMNAYICSWDNGPGLEKRMFRYKWKLPEIGTYAFMWPGMTSEDVVAFLLASYDTWDNVCELINYPTSESEMNLQGYVEYANLDSIPNDHVGINFYIPTRSQVSSKMIEKYYNSKLTLINFNNGFGVRYNNEQGIVFDILQIKSNSGNQYESIKKDVLKMIKESLNIPLPSLNVYKKRERIDNQIVRKELAAFEKKVAEYSQHWNTSKKKSLNDMVRIARERAKGRIQLIEDDAANREIAHPIFYSNRR